MSLKYLLTRGDTKYTGVGYSRVTTTFDHGEEEMARNPKQSFQTPKPRHVHDDPFAKRKLPYPLRVTGSVGLQIWPHILAMCALTTAVVVTSKYTHVNLGISPTLTSVIGFVVGLSITFRNQTAYERYAEGRRLWNQLQTVVRNMGRTIWLQVVLKTFWDVLLTGGVGSSREGYDGTGYPCEPLCY